MLADQWLSSNGPISSSENVYQKFISCGGCLTQILQKRMKIKYKADVTFKQVHKFARHYDQKSYVPTLAGFIRKSNFF